MRSAWLNLRASPKSASWSCPRLLRRMLPPAELTLDVAVDDAFAVEVLNRPEELREEVLGLGNGEADLLHEESGQVVFHVVHDEEGGAAVVVVGRG